MQEDTTNQTKSLESADTTRQRHRNVVLVTMILSNNRSLADFAKKIGLSRQWISNIVNGFKQPTDVEKIRIAKKLSEQMNTNIDTLVLFGNLNDRTYRLPKSNSNNGSNGTIGNDVIVSSEVHK